MKKKVFHLVITENGDSGVVVLNVITDTDKEYLAGIIEDDYNHSLNEDETIEVKPEEIYNTNTWIKVDMDLSYTWTIIEKEIDV
jgi:hypothetical protein